MTPSRTDLYQSAPTLSTLSSNKVALTSELSWFFQAVATAASLLIPSLAATYSVTLNEVFVHDYSTMCFPICVFCLALW